VSIWSPVEEIQQTNWLANSDTQIETGRDQTLAGAEQEHRQGHPLAVALRVSPLTTALLTRRQIWHDFKSGFPLLVVDLLATLLALSAANSAAIILGGAPMIPASAAAAFMAWTLLVQHIHGLYPACGLPHTLEFRRSLRTCLIVTSGLAVGLLFGGSASLSTWLAFATLTGILSILLPGLRSIARSLLCGLDWWSQPVVIIGSSQAAEDLYARLNRSRQEGVRPLGILFDPAQSHDVPASKGRYYIGPLTDLETILTSTGTCRVAVADKSVSSGVDFHIYHGIPHVTFATDLRVHPTEKTRLSERAGNIDVHCFNTLTSPCALTAKRMLDLSLILLCAPLLIPIFAVLALMVRFGSRGPIFYAQSRLGYGGKPFRAWKFRSMVENADAVLARYLEKHPELRAEWDRDHKLKNDPRITRIGKFLRKTSLDELPQIWNVLRGEMSLVGPRPIVNDEISKYGEVYELYTLVRPGITGLWQVSGRNNTSYEERLAYDRYYVLNWSCMLDVYILYRTAKTALLQEGAY
jgi:Undecaprenyl-phosphate galactose phosphotransferase WbaP